MKRSTKLTFGVAGAAVVFVLSVVVYRDYQKEVEEREKEIQAKQDAAAWHEAHKKDVETYRIDNKPASFKGFPGVK